jgi:S1-C subfamily serine protease/lipoprotein NlpI
MKLCQKCDQPVAEEITTCPACGSLISEGRKYIDDYRIVDVLHEGHSSFLCRAIRERTQELVMIRLFTPEAGVDEEVAWRLKRELEQLKKLPAQGFVRHHAIRRSSDGLWYRISEWINTESWGSLLASGRLQDTSVLIDLFWQIASTLAVLHAEGHFIPHLILNDIIVIKDGHEKLEIKIDYKLSRFFDPKLDRPGPMLQNLLNCHPDIVNQRPLDFRSDIWSLGKIFVELLTADLEIRDFLAKLDELDLPDELAVLLKVMLADDPDMRPRSMTEIAQSLARIKKSDYDKAREKPPIAQRAPVRNLTRLHTIVKLLAAAVVVLMVAGFLAWFQMGQREEDSASVLEKFANRYADSVAFLVTEYWLEASDVRYYYNLTEGTAFLVDLDGYMLTGRHVACPWLEDTTLYATAEYLKLSGLKPEFGYRIFLWFDGEKAFNRVASMMQNPELTDVYFTDIAYSTGATPKLTVAGVAKTPSQTRHLLSSPLKDDFAVLKIENVPPGLKALPLELEMDPQKIPKLSPVIALGFPLGRRTQEDTVNVSVTSGNVRRTFKNLIQIDASVHGGNSGGPIIDTHGKVIGIVSGVAMDFSQGVMPAAAPVWDIGMVLPINKAVDLLVELKAGRIKWNGALDFTVEDALNTIREKAVEGRWAEAMTVADEKLAQSPQPALVTAAGMMHFCAADYEGAKRLFSQALSMDADDYQARWMLCLIDWLIDDKAGSLHRQALLDFDWRSEAEFQSYLARVLETLIDEESALQGWFNFSERSWLNFVVGLLHSKRDDLAGAEKLMREAVLIADPDAWEFFLAQAQLDRFQRLRRESMKAETQWNRYRSEIKDFEKAVEEAKANKLERRQNLIELYTKIADGSTDLKAKLNIMEQTHKVIPDNRSILAALAYYSTAAEEWSKALEYIRKFLQSRVRHNARSLSMGLLEACVLNYQGKDQEAQKVVEDYGDRIKNPWFLDIHDYLLGKQTEQSLKEKAGETPEKLVTAYTFMGFWAEGSGKPEKALKQYKVALESFLDDWLEYDFAQERIKKIKASASEEKKNNSTPEKKG